MPRLITIVAIGLVVLLLFVTFASQNIIPILPPTVVNPGTPPSTPPPPDTSVGSYALWVDPPATTWFAGGGKATATFKGAANTAVIWEVFAQIVVCFERCTSYGGSYEKEISDLLAGDSYLDTNILTRQNDVTWTAFIRLGKSRVGPDYVQYPWALEQNVVGGREFVLSKPANPIQPMNIFPVQIFLKLGKGLDGGGHMFGFVLRLEDRTDAQGVARIELAGEVIRVRVTQSSQSWSFIRHSWFGDFLDLSRGGIVRFNLRDSSGQPLPIRPPLSAETDIGNVEKMVTWGYEINPRYWLDGPVILYEPRLVFLDLAQNLWHPYFFTPFEASNGVATWIPAMSSNAGGRDILLLLSDYWVSRGNFYGPKGMLPQKPWDIRILSQVQVEGNLMQFRDPEPRILYLQGTDGYITQTGKNLEEQKFWFLYWSRMNDVLKSGGASVVGPDKVTPLKLGKPLIAMSLAELKELVETTYIRQVTGGIVPLHVPSSCYVGLSTPCYVGSGEERPYSNGVTPWGWHHATGFLGSKQTAIGLASFGAFWFGNFLAARLSSGRSLTFTATWGTTLSQVYTGPFMIIPNQYIGVAERQFQEEDKIFEAGQKWAQDRIKATHCPSCESVLPLDMLPLEDLQVLSLQPTRPFSSGLTVLNLGTVGLQNQYLLLDQGWLLLVGLLAAIIFLSRKRKN